MTKEMQVTLERIKATEQALEVLGLLKPITNDTELELTITHSTFDQIKLYK